ncbi:MAG: preprotein translocase subunit YajC [Clostridia bacterium]|nr:preprotein translocase subunit YajC [Clostridia bacterium]
MAWYYWVVIIGFLAIMYIMLIVRQRKQEKQSKQIMESFKVGDKVITHIGIYGKIKKIYNTTFGKVCVLEIGNTNKIEFELDMRYIAGIDEKTLVADEPETKATEEKPAEDTKTEQLEKASQPEEQEKPQEKQPKKKK